MNAVAVLRMIVQNFDPTVGERRGLVDEALIKQAAVVLLHPRWVVQSKAEGRTWRDVSPFAGQLRFYHRGDASAFCKFWRRQVKDNHGLDCELRIVGEMESRS